MIHNPLALLSKFFSHREASSTGSEDAEAQRYANAITRLLRLASSTATGYQQQQSLEAVRHFKGWAYVAIHAIAKKVAMHKPSVKRKKKLVDGAKSTMSKSFRAKMKKMTDLAEDEDLVPVEKDHPLCQLLEDPNGPDVTFSLWYKTMMYAKLCGKVVWWLPFNNAGEPCEIWVLPTQWLRPDPGTHEDDPLIKGYWVRPTEGVANTTYIDAKDIIEWTWPSPITYYDGYGPMQGGATWLDTSEAMDNSRWHQMKNMHNPGLVIKIDKDFAAAGKLDEPTLKMCYAMLNARLQGEGKNRMPLILPPGWDSAGRFGMTNEELDFTSSDDQIRDKTLALFGVPKGAVGIDPTAATSAYAPNAIFYDQTINPELYFLGQVLTEKLAWRFDEDLVIVWEDASPSDPVLEHQKANDALDRAAITTNEYREHLNMAPVEWGNTPLQRPGYLPLMQGTTKPMLGEDEVTAMLSRDLPDTKPPSSQMPYQPQLPKRIRDRLKKALVPDDAIKVTLPHVKQETSYSCGAAAVSAICRAYGVGPDDEEFYRLQLQTDPEVGTDENIIRTFFDGLGLSTVMSEQTTDEQLKQWLDNCAPVLLLIQAWGSEPTEYSNPRSDNGHYVIAIGYTDDDLIVEDPALENSRGYISWEDLATRWHLPELERWAMCVRKAEKMTMVRSLYRVSKNGVG